MCASNDAEVEILINLQIRPNILRKTGVRELRAKL